MTNGSLMKVESIAECSPWSILQYFWPALSDIWSWKPIFGLLYSGHYKQVLLYMNAQAKILASSQKKVTVHACFNHLLHRLFLDHEIISCF